MGGHLLMAAVRESGARLLPIDSDAARLPLFNEPFRFSPEQVYAFPDWDLVFKAFVDAGQTYVTEPLAFENDEFLLSTGLGLELSVKQNIQVRIDWGIGLSDLDGETFTSGSNRFHFQFGFLY